MLVSDVFIIFLIMPLKLTVVVYWLLKDILCATDVMIPVSVLKPLFLRFHGTGSGTSVLVPTSQY